MITEDVLTIGENRLVGILTRPDGDVPPDRPAVLLLNSGLVHRVGACRVSVTLARRLARAGYPALRFDLAGIGDSPPRRDGLEMDEGHLADIGEAMSHVEALTGARRFVLYGLCSGARYAFRRALVDDRVVGVVQIDPYAYRTVRYYLRHYLPRLAEPAVVWRWLQRVTGFGPDAGSDRGGVYQVAEELWPEYPPREEAEAGYRRLVERGVRLHVIYTGSWSDQYNYAEQFYDMYPDVSFEQALRLRYLPRASHVLPQPEYQESVIEGIAEWLEREFPVAAAGASGGGAERV